MESAVADLEEKTENFDLEEKTNSSESNKINILLLGETGVGKSTIINSLALYLTYSTLKNAEEGHFLSLIPAKFKIQDKYNKYHDIETAGSEPDQNEYLNAGASATQDVKTYVFPIWGGKKQIRLIDTPGMGDTRGIKQDDLNCETILTYLSQLDELHAICFLFKPTNTRITKFFAYCISQILSRLDKSASQNIIFIFTNTRGTDYSPGDTYPILQQVIKDIEERPPHVKIPFDFDKNVFCFDNEVFRYLAAKKQGVEFDSSVTQRFNESWTNSVSQCCRLFKYIAGDDENPPLAPHNVKSTSAINEARRLIVHLAQPLGDITQLITDNLYVLERHKQYLETNMDSLRELRESLYMPVIVLEVIQLARPATVCTSRSCAEIYKVGEIEKWHYKQRCHDPCFLAGVPEKVVGNPSLASCAAMNKGKCKKCPFNCDFSVHMHVYYMTETREQRIIDSNVEKHIDSKEQVLQEVRKLIDDMSQMRVELEEEHEIIVKCCAQFAHFLQNNAITAFNDFYKEYIEYLIVREKSLGDMANSSTVKQLQNLLLGYEETKKAFDEALKSENEDGETEVISNPQKISDTINKLYALKHNGSKIKELYDCQIKSRSKEHEYSEYVHKVVTDESNGASNRWAKKKGKKLSNAYQKPQEKRGLKGLLSKVYSSVIGSDDVIHQGQLPPPYYYPPHHSPGALPFPPPQEAAQYIPPAYGIDPYSKSPLNYNTKPELNVNTCVKGNKSQKGRGTHLSRAAGGYNVPQYWPAHPMYAGMNYPRSPAGYYIPPIQRTDTCRTESSDSTGSVASAQKYIVSKKKKSNLAATQTSRQSFYFLPEHGPHPSWYNAYPPPPPNYKTENATTVSDGVQ